MVQETFQPFFFVGLGNPGVRYETTRHNMGFLVIQAFAKFLGLSFKKDGHFNALVAKGVVDNKTVHLLLPLTFMNLSGNAIRHYADYFKIPIDRLLVAVDDVALPFGSFRYRLKGTSGGHRGLASIENCFGSNHYKRLRMGIGHPGEKILADFVLEPFSPAEQLELPEVILKGVDILSHFLKEDFAGHKADNIDPINTNPFLGPGE